MSKHNDELNRAGVLLALDGLQPTAKGARVSFAGGRPAVTDGPFTEAKELIGGYWLIQAKSKQEAVQWASRCPAADGDVIEVRQVYELSDFVESVESTAPIPMRNSPEAVESTASIPMRDSPGANPAGRWGAVPTGLTDIHETIGAVWRIESTRLIAGLARYVRDVGLAEHLAQDALVAALEQWPQSGIPDNPAGWLMAIAKHRAVDTLRRPQIAERQHDQLGRRLEREHSTSKPDLDAELDDQIGDDLLSLLFTTCHPALSTEARAAVTLRLFGGLETGEIARAFLVRESTVAQRIVRAKRTPAAAWVPLEVPSSDELAARLVPSVDPGVTTNSVRF